MLPASVAPKPVIGLALNVFFQIFDLTLQNVVRRLFLRVFGDQLEIGAIMSPFLLIPENSHVQNRRIQTLCNELAATENPCPDS